ncbi:hypothetical protein HK105_209424 [Polyrhizophydium stewartii]|uniref:Major facilitator superfamily (MFS) profile domain-containing protein n=1 Tax=Polyrhizophydium stewartii TaxID=2732419 RepID=A0ABR4MVA0_9FUNG|nr:Inorganic phosphate transporter pho84 [Polyrhizophydium stewartii]
MFKQFNAGHSVHSRRARAFAHLDEAKLGWFHLRAVLVSGVGFFTDAYDIFVIGQCLTMVYTVYDPPGYSDPQIDALMKASTSWGNLIGQLVFGYLGDKLGRKRMYGVELIIMIISTIGSALSAPAAAAFGILPVLGFWRFLLGIGIGGDYPMSAVITSEFANVRYRGLMLSAVFAMQGIGILVGGLFIIAMLAAFRPLIQQNEVYLDYVWRIVLLIGIFPAFVALYFRLTIPETPRYTVDVIGDEDKAERDVERVLKLNYVADVTSKWGAEEIAERDNRVLVRQNTLEDFVRYFGQWRNLKVLIGVSYSWFALDVAWYGLTLNQSTILTAINYNGSNTQSVYEQFHQKALGSILISLMGTVPGYWVTVALIERMGRKPIQYLGFGVITVCLVIIAVFYEKLSTTHTTYFIVLYTIAQFFFNFGPNSTTFVVPGEVFPTRWRSTGHGIAAASGKLGAIIGVQVVAPRFSSYPAAAIYAFAAIMATGIFSTMLIPETKNKTLEELSFEDSPIIGPIGNNRNDGAASGGSAPGLGMFQQQYSGVPPPSPAMSGANQHQHFSSAASSSSSSAAYHPPSPSNSPAQHTYMAAQTGRSPVFTQQQAAIPSPRMLPSSQMGGSSKPQQRLSQQPQAFPQDLDLSDFAQLQQQVMREQAHESSTDQLQQQQMEQMQAFQELQREKQVIAKLEQQLLDTQTRFDSQDSAASPSQKYPLQPIKVAGLPAPGSPASPRQFFSTSNPALQAESVIPILPAKSPRRGSGSNKPASPLSPAARPPTPSAFVLSSRGDAPAKASAPELAGSRSGKLRGGATVHLVPLRPSTPEDIVMSQ